MTRTTPLSSLRRLAVSNSSSSLLQRTTQPQHILPRIHQTCYHPARRRAFTTTTTNHKQKVYVTKDDLEREFVLDEDIPTRQVTVRNNETGKLNPPQTLISLLSTIDRDKLVVRALATPEDGPAVVEITTKSGLTERLKNKEIAAMESARATRAKKPKQIEVNWAMSSNDLQMKLRQLREFVDKGKKVEILLASRKRQRKATPEEAAVVVDEIRKTISEIEGCKEVAPMEGKIGGQAVIVVQKQA